MGQLTETISAIQFRNSKIKKTSFHYSQNYYCLGRTLNLADHPDRKLPLQFKRLIRVPTLQHSFETFFNHAKVATSISGPHSYISFFYSTTSFFFRSLSKKTSSFVYGGYCMKNGFAYKNGGKKSAIPLPFFFGGFSSMPFGSVCWFCCWSFC